MNENRWVEGLGIVPGRYIRLRINYYWLYPNNRNANERSTSWSSNALERKKELIVVSIEGGNQPLVQRVKRDKIFESFFLQKKTQGYAETIHVYLSGSVLPIMRLASFLSKDTKPHPWENICPHWRSNACFGDE